MVMLMSQYLDRLFRLIDSTDVKSYVNVVITSSLDEYRVLRDRLGSSTLYILLDNVTPNEGNVITLPKLNLDGLWINLSKNHLIIDSINKVKPHIISDIMNALVIISTEPYSLYVTYELLKEVKDLNSRCNVLTLMRLPSMLSDNDALNALIYIAMVLEGGLSNSILVTSDKLFTYLRLIKGIDPLRSCINALLDNYSEISTYLDAYGKLGMILCFPGIELEVFGNLVNTIKFLHHLIGDYEPYINESLLLITKDLILHVDSEAFRRISRDLIRISEIKGQYESMVITIEPRGHLIKSLRRYIHKIYDVSGELRLHINVDKLTYMVGLK